MVVLLINSMTYTVYYSYYTQIIRGYRTGLTSDYQTVQASSKDDAIEQCDFSDYDNGYTINSVECDSDPDSESDYTTDSGVNINGGLYRIF